MRAVSAIIVINLTYVYGWHGLGLLPTRGVGRTVTARPSPVRDVTIDSIEQPNDHFNSSEKRRFQTWYLQSLDFFQRNGPIYIHLLTDDFYQNYPIGWNNTLISVLAEETKGAMFVYQQRYHGESKPKTRKHEYYKYLNISQTLADNAEFIKYLKSQPMFKSSKVVVMGSGRAGNLATWMRVVYPDLVDAVAAATAPLLAKKQVDEYLEHTAHIYDTYGPKNCLNDIEKRFQLFDDALKNTTALEIYKKENQICEENNFTLIEDQQDYIIHQYYDYYMYARDAVLEGIQKCSYFSIDLPGCYEYSLAERIKFAKMDITKRPDSYESCAEYGHFLTTSGNKRPFDYLVPVDYYLKFCKEVFYIDEKRLNEGIAQTNLIYGGITPNVTNVVFTNGEFCPQRLLAVQQNISDAAPAFLVKESDTENIFYIYKQETEDVIEIRNRVKSLIRKWIGL